MKKLLTGSVALVLAVALAGCGANIEDTGNEPDDAGSGLTHIAVGDIKIASQTDAYAAQKLGFFEDHGLDVEFTYAANGQDILTAISSGSLNLGLAIPGTAMTANASGFDFVGVVQDQIAHEEGPDSGGLIVRTDSGISSLADLEGRSLAVNATGANQVYVSIVKTLEDAGVDVSKVQFQEIPFPQMPSVLEQGQVDAVAVVDPFTTMMLSDSAYTDLAWYYVEALPGMPLSTYWGTREWVESHPDEVSAFNAAMTEAVEYLRANPDEARDLIAEFTGLDRALLDNMPDIQWSTEVSVETWEKLIDIYVQAGLLPEAVEVTDLLTAAALD
ncbi:ABC transporter substrate-binding protein [Microbacterium pseudoresistens]